MSPNPPDHSHPKPRRESAVPKILKLVCQLTGMRLALVARIENKKWTTCAIYDRMNYGIEVGDRLDIDAAPFAGATDSPQRPHIGPVDPRQLPGKHDGRRLARVGSCISVPILKSDGHLFGTLCALDSKSVSLKPDLNATLAVLAELLEHQLTAESERDSIEKQLAFERETSRAREEFIAVLGHDLRTPLGAVIGATNLLQVLGPSADRDQMFKIIRKSSHQIGNLIDDVLDFARGRLGAGIALARRRSADLATIVSDAIDELCTIHPGRVIHLRHAGPVIANVDEVRVRQLLSNLISNALQNSPPSEPVSVELNQVGLMARLAITNGGTPLSTKDSDELFAPFASNRSDGSPRSGLGLGLYIASEIVRAHGGTINASSDNRSTTFTVLVPQSIAHQ